ncbi:MAG: TolC family protein [Ignavibacteria bacterium]|nr:TolC family protein [Ignavibacteria bacterium]
MMNKFLVRIAMVTVLSITGITAALSQTRPITLDEAIKTAIRQNRNVQLARLGINKADAQVSEAIGSALPVLSFNAGYNRNIQAPVFFITSGSGQNATTTAIRTGLSNAYSIGGQLTQVLFNSAVFSGIGASKIYATAAEARYKAAVAEVVTETKKKYYSALAANQYREIAKSTLKNAEENLRNIEALFSEGLVAEFDKIRASVTVDNVKPQVTESEAGYSNAVSSLLTYLAMNLDNNVEPVLTDLPIPTDVPAEDSSIVKALRENLDLKALTLQMNVSNEITTIYRSEYYPTLNLFGNWQNQGQSDQFNNFVSATSAVVGLNFSFNVFNGTRTKAKVEQANVDFLALKMQHAQLTDGIKLSVRTIINQLVSAKRRIDAQKSTVMQAQRGYDISRIRYTEGTGSVLEINDAETSLARAKVNSLQALFDYYSMNAEYDRVCGNIEAQYLKLPE